MKIRYLPAPADARRVETGPVVFGDDWPGLFVRGDDALALARDVDEVLAYLDWNLTVPADLCHPFVLALANLRALARRISHDVAVK